MVMLHRLDQLVNAEQVAAMGVDVNAKDLAGNTALMCCCRSKTPCLAALLHSGADPNAAARVSQRVA